jgi:hypothetical protein
VRKSGCGSVTAGPGRPVLKWQLWGRTLALPGLRSGSARTGEGAGENPACMARSGSEIARSAGCPQKLQQVGSEDASALEGLRIELPGHQGGRPF